MSLIKKKNLLYITNYPLDSNASAAIRNKAIIEGLIQCGYNVYTLTREPVTDVKIKDVKQFYFRNKSLAYNIAHSVKMKKNSVIWKLRVSIAKVLETLNLYDNQRILLKNLEDIDLGELQFDIVISSSDSKVSHIIAERLIEIRKLRTNCWVQYWGDPFYDDINRNSIIPSLLIKREEERVLNLANYIFYTSPFTLSKQQKIFPKSAHKMHFIPTPYIKKRYYNNCNDDKFIVGYYGSYFTKDRNVIPLYSAARDLKDINFQFIGCTDAKLESDNNISIKWQVSYNEILEYEEKCNILICLANKQGSTQIPGKLYHYAATNKPILFIYEKGSEEIAEFFKQFNRYYICENTQEEIKKEILKIIHNPSLIPQPIEELDCKSVARRVLEIIGM